MGLMYIQAARVAQEEVAVLVVEALVMVAAREVQMVITEPQPELKVEPGKALLRVNLEKLLANCTQLEEAVL